MGEVMDQEEDRVIHVVAMLPVCGKVTFAAPKNWASEQDRSDYSTSMMQVGCEVRADDGSRG